MQINDRMYAKDFEEGYSIDEWDCIFRKAKNNFIIQKKYLDFLKEGLI